MTPPKITEHRHSLRVRSYELDPYRHVNNGVYVNWFEYSREALIRQGDRTWNWYPDQLGLWFVIVNMNADFLSPALEDEEIELLTRFAHFGKSSVVYRQTAISKRDRTPRARGRAVMAFADQDYKAAAIPDDFRALFAPSPYGDIWTPEEGGERG